MFTLIFVLTALFDNQESIETVVLKTNHLKALHLEKMSYTFYSENKDKIKLNTVQKKGNVFISLQYNKRKKINFSIKNLENFQSLNNVVLKSPHQDYVNIRFSSDLNLDCFYNKGTLLPNSLLMEVNRDKVFWKFNFLNNSCDYVTAKWTTSKNEEFSFNDIKTVTYPIEANNQKPN